MEAAVGDGVAVGCGVSVGDGVAAGCGVSVGFAAAVGRGAVGTNVAVAAGAGIGVSMSPGDGAGTKVGVAAPGGIEVGAGVGTAVAVSDVPGVAEIGTVWNSPDSQAPMAEAMKNKLKSRTVLFRVDTVRTHFFGYSYQEHRELYQT